MARPLLLLACLALAVVVVGNAWVCDDAYITLRTVDNLVHGHGLRWNVAERVQTYTHPLWMAVVAVVYAVTREPYYTTILLSLAVGAAAVWVLVARVAVTPPVAALAVLAAALSNAFVDYSTSGLENPLTHLLLLAFVAVWLRDEEPVARLRHLGLIACLAVLDRMDSGLLLAPALVAAALAVGPRRAVRPLAVAFVPFLLWELFALWYYGALVPNTAFAKLGMGESTGTLLAKGLSYWKASLDFDPLTVVVIAAGAAWGLADRRLRWLAAGLPLYALYVLRIGGDFMGGRFLSAPFVLALGLLATRGARRAEVLTGATVAVLVLGLWPPTPTVWFGSAGRGDARLWYQGGDVVDERLFYSRQAGLLHVFPGAGLADSPRAVAGRRAGELGGVRLQAAVGYFGYHAGPGVHLYDLYALADPLLARLPARTDVIQRIGHYRRVPPEGLAESLREDRNAIRDPVLHALYEDLRLVTRGDLFDPARLAAIWRLNLGHGGVAAAAEPLRRPEPPRVPWSAVRPGVGAPRRFGPAGLLVDLGGAVHPETITLVVDADDGYELYLYHAGVLVHHGQCEAVAVDAPGTREWVHAVRPGARDAGVTELMLIPYEGDDDYSLASVELR
ncbi:MAG: hypothetical protein R3F30_07200 [Planctomycetota bacterium]